MTSDAEIVERVRAGAVDDFALLVVRYEKLVMAAAWNVVRDRHAAEDVTQEAFVAALETIGSLRNVAKFGPWLLAIARNRAAKAVRSRCRAPVPVGELQIEAATPCDRPLSDASAALIALLERLPEHERVVVGLKNLHGHSIPEIAEITARPVGTVTKQLSRAYERLRNWYSEEASS